MYFNPSIQLLVNEEFFRQSSLLIVCIFLAGRLFSSGVLAMEGNWPKVFASQH